MSPRRSAERGNSTFSCGMISLRFFSLKWSIAWGLPLETKYLFLRGIFFVAVDPRAWFAMSFWWRRSRGFHSFPSCHHNRSSVFDNGSCCRPPWSVCTSCRSPRSRNQEEGGWWLCRLVAGWTCSLPTGFPRLLSLHWGVSCNVSW